jgi:chemosensory pili system protein ChpC
MRQLAVRQAEELACVVLPQEELSLLIPNDCVAEILPWRRVKPMPGMPRWCVGTIGWRGQTVVVVDFQLLTSNSGQSHLNRRALVVMHRTTNREGMSFYAIASSGLPRLLHLAEDEVREVEDGRASAAIRSHLTLGTEAVVVPDLRYLEDQVNAVI